MAKKSMIERESKRSRLVEKYAKKRQALKAIISNSGSTPDDVWEAQKKLQAMPRDASAVRRRILTITGGRCQRPMDRKFWAPSGPICRRRQHAKQQAQQPERARELLHLGCCAVQVYTGLVYQGPLLPSRVNRSLARG